MDNLGNWLFGKDAKIWERQANLMQKASNMGT
jgi:hypothetical protein